MYIWLLYNQNTKLYYKTSDVRNGVQVQVWRPKLPNEALFWSKDILTCFKLAENKHTFLTKNKFWTREGFIVEASINCLCVDVIASDAVISLRWATGRVLK